MAGRIPDSFIQDLIARSDIVELIGERVELKRAGREYKGLSPFNHEKTPSFFVSPAKQMFFDFSSGRNGNAVSFLMEYDRLSFVEAVEELACRAGVDVPHEGGVAPQASHDGPLEALGEAARRYRAELARAPQALEYLHRRGLDEATLEAYGIGFAPDGWDFLARGLRDPQHALAAGLLRRREGESGRLYDVFRNRVMFPIRDARGRTIAFGGRTLGNDPAKYLNSPETVVFHKGRHLYGLHEARQALRGALRELWVVEGYMDVAMLARHGLHNAVATLGTAVTAEHLGVLYRAVSRVVFCFDGDAAGRRAALRALEQALPALRDGRECRFMFLPDGHDPDTLVQEIGAEVFAARAGQAMAAPDFLLQHLLEQADPATLEGRARLIELAVPWHRRIGSPALAAVFSDALAERVHLPAEDLARLLTPAAAGRPAAVAPRPARGAAPGGRLVRRLMQLLIEDPTLASAVLNPHELEALPDRGVPALIDALTYFREMPEGGAAGLLERWRGTPRGEALARLPPPAAAEDAQAWRAEFLEGVERLRLAARRASASRMLESAAAHDGVPSEEALDVLKAIGRQLSSTRMVKDE